MNEAFYAFPSEPESLKETILEALSIINKKNYIHIQPWTEMNPTGKIIITQIFKKIDNSDLFMYDLSDLNPNVCFELGYAISRQKPIWGTLDATSRANIDLVNESDIFSLIAYRSHINFEDIVKYFCKDKPYMNLDESFISQFTNILNMEESYRDSTDILYLKSPLGHTASKKLTQFLKKLNRKMIEIDILENSYHPFEDILLNILMSRVVLVHLLNNSHSNYKGVNAVYSFIAGLSVGFNKNTLILAPDPYKPPLDYRHLLFTHKTARECVDKVTNWIFPILSRGVDKDKTKQKLVKNNDNELSLIRFVLGDGQAEHEEKDLDSFFVETSQFHQGLHDKIGIFVGRKGSGKTANLFRIREHFITSKQNFIVTIKPQSFRLETYVKLISDYFNEIDIRSQVTERIWEFIIYSAILYKLYENLQKKPIYYNFSNSENDLFNYVENNLEIITSDFGDKIDYLYNKVKELSLKSINNKKIIEILFNEYLSDIKNLLQNSLSNYDRIIILIDNLDKAWDFGKNIDLQCKVIYGILGFHNSLVKELKWKKGDIRFLIFLREDIYKMVSDKAREPDKLLLNTTRLEWNDKDLLLRVIEERFIHFDNSLTSDSIWKTLFCETIDDIPTKDYLFINILKRPRDLIYLVKSAINESVNHRNRIIEADDIKNAQKIYFDFLVSNTVTEYKLFVPEIKSIIHSFQHCPETFDFRYLKKRLKQFTSSKDQLDILIRFLFNISFLGMCKNDSYLFSNNENETEQMMHNYKVETKKFFKKIKFKINYPYYIGLKKEF